MTSEAKAVFCRGKDFTKHSNTRYNLERNIVNGHPVHEVCIQSKYPAHRNSKCETWKRISFENYSKRKVGKCLTEVVASAKVITLKLSLS